MFKNLLILLLSTFLLFSCSKKDKQEMISKPSDEEIGMQQKNLKKPKVYCHSMYGQAKQVSWLAMQIILEILIQMQFSD